MVRVSEFERGKTKALAFGLLLALVVAGLLLTATKPAQALGQTFEVVGGASGLDLQGALDQARDVPGHDIVEFKQPEMYHRLSNAVLIDDPDGVTIEGNGAKLEQGAQGVPTFHIGSQVDTGNVVINELEITQNGSQTSVVDRQSGIIVESSAALWLTNSTVHHNAHGIINRGLTFMINSTVSGNKFNGIMNEGSLEIYASTIADNGVGIDNNHAFPTSLMRTIVADNSARDVEGTFSTVGYNLVGKDDGSTGLTDGVGGDQVGTSANPLDPGLRPLGYGQLTAPDPSDPGPDIPSDVPPTPVHPLRIDSPAVDAIDPSQCGLYLALPLYSPSFMVDQRGVARPWGPACDIGAFEREPVPVQAAADAYSTDEGTPLTVGSPGVLGNDYDWGVSPIVVVSPRPASGPSNGALVLNADGSFTYTPDEGFTGTDSFTYTASHGGLLTSAPTTVTITVTLEGTPPSSYDFSGFFKPVDNPDVATNKVKAGSAIPVKFSLGGDMGLDIFEEGYPKNEQILDPKVEVDGVEQTVTAGSSGLSYDPATGVYTYVWKTDREWANSFRQLVLKFNDGTTVKRANFNFTR